MATSTTLNIGWNANSEPDLDHYNVYRGTVSGFSVTPGVTVPTGTPTTNSFTDTGLTSSTTYYYRISAVDQSGNIGTLSNQASGSTLAATGGPAQVTGLSATPFGQMYSNVYLIWNANTEPDLSHYLVYRGTTAGFAVTPGVTTPFTTITAPATDTYGGTYSPSTTYYFKVCAVNTIGAFGTLSAEVSATVAATTTVTSSFYLPFNGDQSDLGPYQLQTMGYHINGWISPGKFGNGGFKFNYPTVVTTGGTVDRIDIEKFAMPVLIQMDPVVGFSVSFWINPQINTALPYRRVLAEKADSPTQKWTIQLDSSGIAYFFVMKAGTIYKRQVSGFTTNSWQHVAAVFNGSTNTVAIYRNGTAGVSSTATPQWPGTGNGSPLTMLFNIGGRLDIALGGATDSDGGNLDTMFQGYMDEFLWYRSYLLSQAEVTSLVNSNITNTSGQGYVPPPWAPNLWLKLDGTYADASGFSNTVTPSNSSGFAGSGQFGGNSVRLNTPTLGLDNISVTTNTNVELDMTNGFTYSFWFYSVSTNTTQYILSKRIDANNWMTIYFNGSTGDLSSNMVEAADPISLLGGSGLSLNTWHHVMFVYNGVDDTRTFVDTNPPFYGPIGIPMASTPTTTTNLIIGNLSGSTDGTKVFRGRIDELQYFKGQRLDMNQAVKLYNTNNPN